jgi:hypothetical protein
LFNCLRPDVAAGAEARGFDFGKDDFDLFFCLFLGELALAIIYFEARNRKIRRFV